MPELLKANILVTSDLNPLNFWSILWTMILYQVLPVMIDGCKVPICFYSFIKFLEQVTHKLGHECTTLIHYYVIRHTVF